VLSLIKFGGASSIALDSFPSYFAAAFFHPLLGGLVAMFGHLLSAASGGFPFSLPVHLLVAGLQALWAIIFGVIPRFGNNIYLLVISAPLTIFLNGYLAAHIIVYYFPELKGPVLALIPVLFFASTVNVFVAIVALIVMRRLPTTKG